MSPTVMSTVLLLLGLFNFTTAYICTNGTYNFTLSAVSNSFGNIAIPTANEDVVTFALNATRQGQNFAAEAQTGQHTPSGNYQIATQFCVPSRRSKGAQALRGKDPITQVLTHEIRFDRTYVAVATDTSANPFLQLFFAPPFFIADMLAFVPMALGEALTLVSSLVPSSSYTSPVLAIIGDTDLPFCGGDCVNANNPTLGNLAQGVGKAFQSARTFEGYIQPDTGHGWNMHENSTGGYAVLGDWLGELGVGF